MKTIPYGTVVETVRDLCLSAAFRLPPDVKAGMKRAMKKETSPLALSLLSRCVENARIAERGQIPICQDTGIAVFFVDCGCGVRIRGGTLADAINEGTKEGYRRGFLRPSMVDDPLYERKNTATNTPAVVHYTPVDGDSLSITCAPKGGGCENISALSMLRPSDGEAGVIEFCAQTVVRAGGNPCPPVITGVGIGGTAELCLLLSKKALYRPLGRRHRLRRFAELELTILDKINSSGVGAGGLGGCVTSLAVHIETFPCHIATLPVAVSLSCHAARHATAVL
jgi:fumarate hydratase subunit alpha